MVLNLVRSYHMRSLLAAAVLVGIALPGAAYAADEAMEKCCCETVKHEGKDCCPEKETPAPQGDHAAHGEHHAEPTAD
jgi:hypothetical protein